MDERLKKRISNLTSNKKENLIGECEERMVTLRKQKLEKHFEFKRMLNFNPYSKYEILEEDIDLKNSPFEKFKTEFDIHGLTKEIITGINGNVEEIKASVYFIRRHYQFRISDPSTQCINKQFVDQLFNLYKRGDLKLQFEVVWIFINLTASSKDVSLFLSSDEILISLTQTLITTNDQYMISHLMNLLSNMVVDSLQIRDAVILRVTFGFLFQILSETDHQALIQKAFKLLSNVFMYKFNNNETDVMDSLKLTELVFKNKFTDEEVYIQGLELVMKITFLDEFKEKTLSFIIGSDGILTKLFYYSGAHTLQTQIICMTSICNLSTSSSREILNLIGRGVLDVLKSKLDYRTNPKVLFHTLRTIGNISSETISHIQHLQSSGIILKTFDIFCKIWKKSFSDTCDQMIIKEIYYILCYCITGGNLSMIYDIIITNDIINIEETLVKGLELYKNDEFLLKQIGAAIFLLIKNDFFKKDTQFFKEKFVNEGICDKLQMLLEEKGSSTAVYDFFLSLLEEFEIGERYAVEDEEMIEEDYSDGYCTDEK